MRDKLPVCLLVIFPIWLNLFAPLACAQKPVGQPPADGLQFRTREAAKRAEKPQKRPPATIENLSAAEADEIFSRLPPLTAEKEDDTAFKMRGDTVKPPKTGNVIPVEFPAEEKKSLPKVKKEAKVEEMYMPETFGRSKTNYVRVE